MIRFKFVILMFFLLSGCKSMHKIDYKKQPEYVSLAHKIMIDTSSELEKKKKLYMIGIGGELMDKVEELEISFVSENLLELKQARDLVIFSAQLFLKNINTNAEIKQCLIHYPFQIKDIKIFINTRNENSSIKAITLSSGKLIFYISDNEEVLKRTHEETYEEALRIINNEKSS